MSTVAAASDSSSLSSMAGYFASLAMVRGIYLPPFWEDWESHLDALAGFETRPDDVFVVSYQKCGHHWSHEFLSMILSGETRMPKERKGDNFLELLSVENLEEKQSPRLFLTHLPFQFLPKQILENRNKIVRLTRNPKDVCVSYYNHCRIKDEAWEVFLRNARPCAQTSNFSGPLSDFFEAFLDGQVEYGSFFDFERRYKSELGGDDRLDHVFHTSFETLKQHPLQSMKALGAFLGVARSEPFYEEVVDKTSFEKVKAVRDQDELGKVFIEEGNSLYRKGQVGDWVHHLTVAQSRRVDAMIERYQLKFVHEL